MIILILGIFFTAMGGTMILSQQSYKKNCSSLATARIIRQDLPQNQGENSLSKIVICYTPALEPLETEFGTAHPEKYPVGETCPIRYDPQKPREVVSLREKRPTPGFMKILLAIGIILDIVGIAWFMF